VRCNESAKELSQDRLHPVFLEIDLLTSFISLPLKYRQPPWGTLATQAASALLPHTTSYTASCSKGKVFQQELRK